MIELSLFNTLCSDFHIHIFPRRKKKLRRLEEMRIEFTNFLADGVEYLHAHVLGKVVQYTQSEYGFIARPALGNVLFNVETFARTSEVTRDAEYRCVTDGVMNDKVFKDGQIYVDNKPSKRYPYIKRFAVCPIMNKGEVVAFLVLCNRLKTYTKKDLQPVKELLDELTYIFTNDSFI